jgi:hypothetical protein
MIRVPSHNVTGSVVPALQKGNPSVCGGVARELNSNLTS